MTTIAWILFVFDIIFLNTMNRDTFLAFKFGMTWYLVSCEQLEILENRPMLSLDVMQTVGGTTSHFVAHQPDELLLTKHDTFA